MKNVRLPALITLAFLAAAAPTGAARAMNCNGVMSGQAYENFGQPVVHESNEVTSKISDIVRKLHSRESWQHFTDSTRFLKFLMASRKKVTWSQLYAVLGEAVVKVPVIAGDFRLQLSQIETEVIPALHESTLARVKEGNQLLADLDIQIENAQTHSEQLELVTNKSALESQMRLISGYAAQRVHFTEQLDLAHTYLDRVETAIREMRRLLSPSWANKPVTKDDPLYKLMIEIEESMSLKN